MAAVVKYRFSANCQALACFAAADSHGGAHPHDQRQRQGPGDMSCRLETTQGAWKAEDTANMDTGVKLPWNNGAVKTTTRPMLR